MKHSLALLAVSALLTLSPAQAQQEQQERTYDYFSANRTMIRNGVQAVLLCNGLFTGHRTLEQVYAHELKYLTSPRFGGAVGNADGGEYVVDRDKKAVAIGGPTTGPLHRRTARMRNLGQSLRLRF